MFSAFAMITAGILADKKSRINICFIGCLLYASISILTILIPEGRLGYSLFLLTRALSGIGIGLVIPSIYSLLGDTIDAERRTIGFGFVTVAILMGRLTGFGIAGTFQPNWRNAYFILGLVNLFLAFSLLRIREPRRGIKEKELHEVLSAGAEYSFKISKNDIKFIRSNYSNLWLIINFIDVFPGAIILFLIFKYMKDIHNMDTGDVNTIILVVFLFGALGALFFGRLGDLWFRKNKRAKVILALICNGLPILFMFIFIQTNFWIPENTSFLSMLEIPGVIIMIAAVAGAMFLNQGVTPNWYSTLADVNLPEHRGTMVSIASVMDLLGHALGPLIASYIASHWGLRAAMRSVILFWGLNILFWLPLLIVVKKDLGKIHGLLLTRADKLRDKLVSLKK
jgi:MFS transporter, Spinster family, sphingosine-1-phosphate transporter